VSKSDAGAAGEWQLYWTARGQPVPCRLVPLLSGWADLDERENAADIGARHPILIDPKSRIDPVLARFLGRSRFAWLAEGTRQAYAKDYRMFFSFLWQRGRYWHEADPDDLLDWEAWRRRGQQPGRGLGGSKWERELAALRMVYEWAEKEQHTACSPVLVHQVRLRGGGTAMVADQAPRDVRSADTSGSRRAAADLERCRDARTPGERMTGAIGCAVTAASPGGGQGWPRCGRQHRRRSYQGDVREGDFPPVPAPEAPLDDAGQCVLPGGGERTAACSSGCRTGENARAWAVEVGFEPTERLPPHTLSRRARSATTRLHRG
jgi:Phage integrase, N-terminal SAM-like domain